MSQNNVEDLYALKNDGGLRLFSEDEIKNYTNYTTSNYTQKTHYKHTKKKCSNYIENKIHIYQQNWLHESDECNQPIYLNEVKRALSLLRNNKSEDPDTI